VSGLSASVGIAMFPDDGAEPPALLAVADRSLLERKRVRYAGRGRGRAA
jgi:GGDEF domain-containing protein